MKTVNWWPPPRPSFAAPTRREADNSEERSQDKYAQTQTIDATHTLVATKNRVRLVRYWSGNPCGPCESTEGAYVEAQQYLCEICFDAMTTHETDVSGWSMGVCDDCLAPPEDHPCWEEFSVALSGLTAAEIALIRTARPGGEYVYHPTETLFRVLLPDDALLVMGPTARRGSRPTTLSHLVRVSQQPPDRWRVIENLPEITAADVEGVEGFLASLPHEELSEEDVARVMVYVRERLAQEQGQ